MEKSELVVMGAASPCFSVSVTDSASSAAACGASQNNFLRVVNAGASNAFIALGGASVAATVPTGTAATTSTPVLAGSDNIFSVDSTHTHISAICATGLTATLYVQRCGGV